jgi:hypothetical protein
VGRSVPCKVDIKHFQKVLIQKPSQYSETEDLLNGPQPRFDTVKTRPTTKLYVGYIPYAKSGNIQYHSILISLIYSKHLSTSFSPQFLHYVHTLESLPSLLFAISTKRPNSHLYRCKGNRLIQAISRQFRNVKPNLGPLDTTRSPQVLCI